MMNPLDVNRNTYQQKPSYLMPLVVGCGAFIVGVGLTFGYSQWQSQQEQLARMSTLLDDMQRERSNEPVTRNAPLDLLTVAAPSPTPTAAPAPKASTAVAAVQTPEPTPVAAPAPAETVDKVAVTTADRIRELVSRSSDPLVSAAIAQDVARRETMSIAIQGVNELVEAASAGGYTISTDGKNADGSGGRLRIEFPNHAEDQAELERLLGSAAQAGMIAFNESVKGSDGSFDGRVILFDLVERALVNGTEAERRAGLEIRQKAVALLSNNSQQSTPTSQTASGDRFYTVQPGDSLAYIALQFYGNTNDYRRIFSANSNILTSPEKIQIGQKLLIPTI